MTEKESIKLLADFMGIEVKEYGSILGTAQPFSDYWWNPERHELYEPNIRWGHIMPIVEKIETMDYGFKMCRKVVEVYIDSSKEVLYTVKKDSRINSLFEVVVKFVEYYNKEKLHETF